MGRTHFTAVTTAPREDRAGRAIALMLSAYLCFTCVDVCAKWMVRAGVPPLEVVFIRYFGHMVFAAAIFIPTLGASFLRAKAPKLQIGRAVVLLLSTVCNFIAVQYLPLSLTSAIASTAPPLRRSERCDAPVAVSAAAMSPLQLRRHCRCHDVPMR